ncbi:hypothetical protein [Marasmitruncus massiliensis]|uniref:hypothetical protein n=1 Tax=Marasmitruncus massiliensis TaxID=1944642 RepID=UPI000C7A4F2C|nr:hypothetical protein [Marasmitruncus massiliensis]
MEQEIIIIIENLASEFLDMYHAVQKKEIKLEHVANQMKLRIFTGRPLGTSLLEYWDFRCAKAHVFEEFKKKDGKSFQFIIVDREIDTVNKLLFLTGALVFLYIEDRFDEQESEDLIKLLHLGIRTLSFESEQHLWNSFPCLYEITLCVLMPKQSVINYLREKNMVVREIIGSSDELLVFANAFLVKKIDAQNRLRLLYKTRIRALP